MILYQLRDRTSRRIQSGMRRSSNLIVMAGALALAFSASLLFASRAQCGEDRPQETLALLDRARTLEDLREDGASPFVLHAQLKYTSPKGGAGGSYLLVWVSKDRWHEEVRFGDFVRIRDAVDGGYRQMRSWEYEPQIIWDLTSMLGVDKLMRLGPRESASKPRNRKIGGRPLSCVETETGERKFKMGEICFDPTTGLLVHRTATSAGGELEVDYSDEAAVGAKQFPREIRGERKGEFALDVIVDQLKTRDESLPLPVPDSASSEFWASCTDPTPPEMISKQVFPHYPDEAKLHHEQGDVTIYERIEADGSVSHLHLLSAPSPALAQSAMDAVAKFRYKPPTCGGAPIRMETVATVVFRMSS